MAFYLLFIFIERLFFGYAVFFFFFFFYFLFLTLPPPPPPPPSPPSSQKASALIALCPKVTVSYTHIVNCSLCTKTQVYTAQRAYTVNKKPGEVHTTSVHGNRDCCHCRFTHAHCNLQAMHQGVFLYSKGVHRRDSEEAYDTRQQCTVTEIVKKLTTHNTSAR